MENTLITKDTPIITVPFWKCSKTKKVAKQININYELFCSYNNWFKIDQEFHYFKTIYSPYQLINSLINEQISNHFGIKNVQIKIGCRKMNKKVSYGSLTKNFRKENFKYITLDTLGYRQMSNLVGINQLENLNKDNKSLIENFKTLMIRDFLANETDRANPANLLLEKNQSTYQMAPLFDNENSLLRHKQTEASKIYENSIATLDVDNKTSIQTLKTDLTYQEQIQKALSYPINKDLIKIQDTFHLDITKDITADYQALIKKKQNTLKKFVK